MGVRHDNILIIQPLRNIRHPQPQRNQLNHTPEKTQ